MNTYIDAENQPSELPTVVVMHGLDGRHFLMKIMESRFRRRGYDVLNFGYPARTSKTPELAEKLGEFLEGNVEKTTPLAFVTHSMGGIVLRRAFERELIDRDVKRVVMLGPPNNGSQMARYLKPIPPFHWIFGPALSELAHLDFNDPMTKSTSVGIIAGTGIKRLGWIPVFGEDNDGVVSLSETRLPGAAQYHHFACAHGWLPISHKSFVLAERFIRHGSFTENPEEGFR